MSKLQNAAATLGKKGGKVKSTAKKETAKANGLKGGRPPLIQLTKEQAQAIIDIRHGVDVWDYFLAKTLREIQKDHPEAYKSYFTITSPQAYQGDGVGKVPYFGAMATRIGVIQANKTLEAYL